MNARLALLAARRVAHPVLLLPLAAAAVAVLADGAASALADDAGLRGEAARAAARTESSWTAFLALVAPFLALRAAGVRGRGEAAWAAVSRTSLARAEAARAAGAVLAALLVVLAWSAFVAAGPASTAPVLARAGTLRGPPTALVAHGAPLVWESPVPDEQGLRARLSVSLSIAPGGGGAARLSAARVADPAAVEVGVAHVLPRGEVEVALPRGHGPVRFELALPEPEARGFVARDDVSLWRVAAPGAARTRLAERAALAVAAWTLLAFGLGAWLRPTLVVVLLASAWGAAWTLEAAPAWVPGAGLADDVTAAAAGRAPAAIGAAELLALAGCAVLALLLAQRAPESRP